LQEREGTTDGQLLNSFVYHKDDAALATLMRRHGPMVWSVCRRLLRSDHDAEDAFQATFLILVKKAATIRDNEMVGNWLYGVGHQTAVRMRAIAARRCLREKQVSEMPESEVVQRDLWNELKPILDQELSRLSEPHRVLIVLCHLEGRSIKEVARQLGCPEGTAASRLARARAILAKRLVRRGVTVSSGMLGAILSAQAASASIPSAVLCSTMEVATLLMAGQNAAGAISLTVASLISGVTRSMYITKIKSVLMVVLAVGMTLGGAEAGVGLFSDTEVVAQQPGTSPIKVKKPVAKVQNDDEVPPNFRLQKAQALLLWPDAVVKLQLSDEQKDKVETIQKEYLTKQQEKSKALQAYEKVIESKDSDVRAKALKEAWQDRIKLRNQYLGKVEALLNDKQKKTFAEVKNLPVIGAHFLPPQIQSDLKLTEEQKQKIANLQMELKLKINLVLTENQRKQLRELKKKANILPGLVSGPMVLPTGK
jgi:RNA polymerase sigma factor (sigma-70 family)